MSDERWLPVVGWEGLYEVSDRGRVRSLPRSVPCRNNKTRNITGKVLAQSKLRGGYLIIKLVHGSRRQTTTVHSLVLTAFVGPRPDGMECCHEDGDKANNALSNLRWDTKLENQLDAVRIGTRPDPFRTHCQNRHELTPDNTYVARSRSTERGQCRTCMRAASRRWKERRKLAATSD